MNAESLIQFVVASSWIIFFAVAAFYGIITLILVHHWNKYGVRLESLRRVRRVYFGVSGALFAVMLVLLIFLQLQ